MFVLFLLCSISYLFFSHAEDGAQDLVYAKQVLYHRPTFSAIGVSVFDFSFETGSYL